ncbi:MAG TPA: xanthine dehydrogenase family protein molybdopterin-binding subunit [Syntrophorhabdaceae bacterium]|nr:xanthine dehydrogenase family protein molybdopterin-binding subunit [Syntrophorhabdaceae bacterium]
MIGRRIPRIDGPIKATGEAKYTTDIYLPDMLVAKMLRSPLPHAKILNIDISKAKKIPGVKAIITGRDAWDIRHGFVETPRYPADQYCLANDRVRYIGEEIACVAAVDEDTAYEAIDAIKVTYEELPAVFDIFEAIKPDAPDIHEFRLPDLIEPFKNVGGRCANSFGDMEAAFKKAYLIREDRFETQLRTHCYLEPQATVAYYDVNGKLNVWTSSMGVFRKRMHLSKTLHMPLSKIRIHKSWVGGAFGGKIDLFSHEFCTSLLSIKTGKPVKYVAERDEIFSYFRHGQPMVIDLKTLVAKDGTILGQIVRCYNNCGAYRGSGVVCIFLCWGFIILPYRIPALDYIGYSIYTNNPVRAPQRGHGAPQVRFAVESQLDIIAEELGIDPIEIRLKNARQKGDILPNGDTIKNAGLIECIEEIEKKTDFRKKYSKNLKEVKQYKNNTRFRRGIGIGVSSYFTGTLIYPHNSAAIIKFNDDGTVQCYTGALDIGQGAETILAQIIAEELSIDIKDIEIIAGDTDNTPVDIGSWISGLTYVTGNAVKKASEDARKQLLSSAAIYLNVHMDSLDMRDRIIFVKDNPERSITFSKVLENHIRDHKGDPIIGKGFFRGLKDAEHGPSLKNAKGAWSDSYAFDAQVAEVEVDMHTGKIKVIKATTAHDCGFPINPLLVEGQIDGQVSMAAGQALSEEIIMEKGITLNPSFLEYKLPIATEMVENDYIDIITEEYKKDHHFHTKEVGEGYVSGILAAIANAVYNATGVRAKRLPIRIINNLS